MAEEELDLNVPQTVASDVDRSDESEPEVDLGTELEVFVVEKSKTTKAQHLKKNPLKQSFKDI